MRSPSARLPAVLGVAVVVLLAVAAGWLLHFGATGSGPADADAALLTDAVAVRNPGLTDAAVTITTIGSTAAMAVLAAAMCVVSWLRGRRADALFVAAAAIGGSALFRLLKTLFDRPRPPLATRLVTETDASLPSGHATMAVIIVGALVVLVWRGRGNPVRVVLVAAAVLWAVAVGATRIYLGVHWFSDVLAGWFVGATWLAVCVLVRLSWGGRPGGTAPLDPDPLAPDLPARAANAGPPARRASLVAAGSCTDAARNRAGAPTVDQHVTTRMRVRAPELRGRRWLGTGGRELSLADLRGKIVLLDFWTFCCVNCLHVLDELRPLEERWSDVLVTVGVHSPKFVHEGDPHAVEAAVERYGVGHPVLDDPTLLTWDAYAARAWPTLVVIDPTGYVVAQMSGEGHAHGLDVLIGELVAEHEAAGTLHRGDGPYVAPPEPATALRFPGKVIALPGGSFLVSDTAHHQLVELDDDLVTERRRIGTGERGLRDGTAAWFSEPQGLLAVPLDVAAEVGYDVVVADSVNHALRGLRLSDGDVRTLAGTGAQLRERVAVGDTADELSTPWDLAWWDGRVVVAMAGSHQLWSFDPRAGTTSVLAGTTSEGLRDGPPADAFFAQPSGLATGADGTLWVADPETSALREMVAAPGAGAAVTTAVGLGLFDFGFRDGPAAEALLQHPLGVEVLPDGSVAIADTYNGALRRYDPTTRTVTTLVRDLREPSDVLVDGETLVVVESAAHRLVRLPIPAGARVDAGVHTVRRSRTDLAPGPLRLTVAFTPPTGQHLDTRFGAPTSLTVSASPPSLLISGAGTAQGLVRELEMAGTEGVLQISVAAAACDDGDGVFAACHRYQQDWGIPVRLVDGAPAELTLDLRAV